MTPLPIRVAVADPGAGTPFHDHQLCRALAAAGCRVLLATSPFLYGEVPEPDGYDRTLSFHPFLAAPGAAFWTRHGTLRRAAKAVSYPLGWRRTARRLRAFGAELVHLQWSVDPVFDAWWLRRLRRRGARCVYTAHNPAPHPGEPTRRSGWGGLLDSCEAIITPSRATADQLRRRQPAIGDRLHRIPIGPGEEALAADPAAARRELGIPEAAPVALFFGLIKPYKGLDDLISALARVRSELADARLIIAGLPKMPYEPFRQLTDRLGLAEAVIADLRFVPSARVRVYFAAADVVVLPYRQASQSGVPLTAYSFNRPVVATDVGGLAEMVVPQRSGILVPAGDEPALARGLVQLLADRPRTRRMGDFARRLIAERYSWPSIAAATIRLYRTILER